MLMVTKISRLLTSLKWLPRVKLHNTLITWSCNITPQNKTLISLVPQWFIAINLGRMVTYPEKLLSIKLLNPLNTWSCKIT